MTASAQTPRPPQLATAVDLLSIPEADRRHEVLDGELVPKAMGNQRHGLGQAHGMGWLIPRYSRRENGPLRPGGWWILSEVEIELAAHQVVRPDIAGWRRERMPELTADYPCALRPDWVCEIMTDSDARRRDGVQKRRIYSDHAVPHYWLVDTEKQTLTVLRWTPRGYVEQLEAKRGDIAHAEPFESLPLPVGILFGDDEA